MPRFKPTDVGDTPDFFVQNIPSGRFKPTSVGDTGTQNSPSRPNSRFKPTSVGDTGIRHRESDKPGRFKPTSVGDTFLGLNYLYQKQKATGNPIALIISQVSDQSSHAIYVKP